MRNRLTQEDLEKLKHWVEKTNDKRTCKTCGDKCLITNKGEKQ